MIFIYLGQLYYYATSQVNVPLQIMMGHTTCRVVWLSSLTRTQMTSSKLAIYSRCIKNSKCSRPRNEANVKLVLVLLDNWIRMKQME